MILFLVTVVYVIFGAYMGVLADQRQMRQSVPYGELPSIVSLRRWRFIMYAVCIFGGVPLIVCAEIERFIERRAKGFFR